MLMPRTPSAARTVNQTIITGPKMRPTTAVPNRWARNSSRMITAVIGTTASAKPGRITFRPSTADSTEMAGVIMLSPRNSAAPSTPRLANTSAVRRPPRRPDAPHRRNSVISAMIPPSPWLSTRMASET
jgi:hypothetical protein